MWHFAEVSMVSMGIWEVFHKTFCSKPFKLLGAFIRIQNIIQGFFFFSYFSSFVLPCLILSRFKEETICVVFTEYLFL